MSEHTSWSFGCTSQMYVTGRKVSMGSRRSMPRCVLELSLRRAVMSYLTSGLSSLSDFDTYSKALCTCTVMILLHKDADVLAGSMQAQCKTARFFQASHHAHAMKWYKTDVVDVSAAIAAALRCCSARMWL